LNPAGQLVDFDGEHDAMLNLPIHSIDYYDATCWPSIDAILARAPRISPVVVGVLNRYLDFCREFGLRYQDPDVFSDGFFEWLRMTHPDQHRAYEEQEALLAARERTAASQSPSPSARASGPL
jgi:hypothetical protein